MADVDFEAREDDMLDTMDEAEPRARSTATNHKKKGRGFRDQQEHTIHDAYDTLPTDKGPAKSVEGWVVFVTGVHEEAQEEDVVGAFSDFGHVKNCYLNLDRRTGFVKGYALVEFSSKTEAQDAIKGMNGQEILTQPVNVTWAFGSGPCRKVRN